MQIRPSLQTMPRLWCVRARLRACRLSAFVSSLILVALSHSLSMDIHTYCVLVCSLSVSLSVCLSVCLSVLLLVQLTAARCGGSRGVDGQLSWEEQCAPILVKLLKGGLSSVHVYMYVYPYVYLFPCLYLLCVYVYVCVCVCLWPYLSQDS